MNPRIDIDFDEFIEELELSGSQLKKIREFIGLSQLDIAEKLDVDRTTITKQEGQPKLAKRFLRQFFGLFREYGIEYLREIIATSTDEEHESDYDIFQTNKKESKMDFNKYFEQKTLQMDDSTQRELARLKSENDRQREGMLRKENEVYDLKNQFTRIEGKIELFEAKIGFEIKDKMLELRNELNNSLNVIKETFRKELTLIEDRIFKNVEVELASEVEKIQNSEPKGGLSGLIQNQSILDGIGKVIAAAGPEIVLGLAATLLKPTTKNIATETVPLINPLDATLSVNDTVNPPEFTDEINPEEHTEESENHYESTRYMNNSR